MHFRGLNKRAPVLSMLSRLTFYASTILHACPRTGVKEVKAIQYLRDVIYLRKSLFTGVRLHACRTLFFNFDLGINMILPLHTLPTLKLSQPTAVE